VGANKAVFIKKINILYHSNKTNVFFYVKLMNYLVNYIAFLNMQAFGFNDFIKYFSL